MGETKFCLVPRSSSPGGSGLAFATTYAIQLLFHIHTRLARLHFFRVEAITCNSYDLGPRLLRQAPLPHPRLYQTWVTGPLLILRDGESLLFLHTLALPTFLELGEIIFFPFCGVVVLGIDH